MIVRRVESSAKKRTDPEIGRKMDRELTRDYLQKSGMNVVQAEALSRVLADTEERLATKADLAALRTELKAEIADLRAEMHAEFAAVRAEIKNLRTELKGDMAALRNELKGDMAALRNELKGDMAALKADLTWRFIAVTAFLAAVMTLLDLFVD